MADHQPLSRTTSTESTPSQPSTSSWQPPSGRKARASEPQAGTESIEVKLSPLGTSALAPMRPIGLTARRPSKASDSLKDYFGRNNMHSGSAIDEDGDATPLAASRYPSSLSEAKSRSDVDAAENRLSFSSLYSIGSAIYANTRGHSWSGRSSVVGSEPDGMHRVIARVHQS
jgi:inositol hexakisphosphate/diphosphoinositol-pentakisphosphate kinase